MHIVADRAKHNNCMRDKNMFQSERSQNTSIPKKLLQVSQKLCNKLAIFSLYNIVLESETEPRIESKKQQQTRQQQGITSLELGTCAPLREVRGP